MCVQKICIFIIIETSQVTLVLIAAPLICFNQSMEGKLKNIEPEKYLR